MSQISELNPSLVWKYFDEITKIPRPSKHEGKIIAYLVDFAQRSKLKYKKDSVGNVVIYKPATADMESRSAVILQSHVDMVCEKNSDVIFDFSTEAIRTRIEDGWVVATGTTLGADCGIGMAAALAVLASIDIQHGPLEALFTVDEETGLTGAFGLGDDMLSGKYLINLDSEDEGEIFIGCAGGIDTISKFEYKTVKPEKNQTFFRIDIRGLKGGHSGDDIEKGRANSNKLLSRFLWQGWKMFDLSLAYFDGGNLRNAIPREAFGLFSVATKDIKQMFEFFEIFRDNVSVEFQYTEPDMEIIISEMPTPNETLDPKSQRALIDALCAVPNGVLSMSAAMQGLVETSTNLASVKFHDHNRIVITTSQRSSIESARNAAADSVESVFRLAGGIVEHSDGYPGWNPNPDSYVLDATLDSYRALFGTDPKVRAIHAGLECGLFLEKYPWLEMVSFGPTLRGVHSPDERLDIASVDKFWKLLIEVLVRIE